MEPARRRRPKRRIDRSQISERIRRVADLPPGAGRTAAMQAIADDAHVALSTVYVWSRRLRHGQEIA